MQNLTIVKVNAHLLQFSEEMVNLMCQYVYDLALMAQRALNAEEMTDFVARSNKVLTKLTKR